MKLQSKRIPRPRGSAARPDHAGDEQPLLVLDEQRHIQFVNQAFERLGWSAGDVAGMDMAKALCRPANAKSVASTLEKAFAGRLRASKLSVRNSAGRDINLSVRFSLMKGGSLHGLAVTVHAWHPVDRAPEACLGDLVYDVTTRPFGTVTSVSGSALTMRPETVVGRRCFTVFSDRMAPCVGCPARTATGKMQLGVVSSLRTSASVSLVAARLVDSAMVRVNVIELPSGVVNQIIQARMTQLYAQHAVTPREREVLDLIVLGCSVLDIGAALHISRSTAKFHQANALKKLGAESRVDLLRLLI